MNPNFNCRWKICAPDIPLCCAFLVLSKAHAQKYQGLLQQAFSRYDLGDKVEKNDKRTCLEKKFLLKRIRIRQEMDLKIPKALSNRVFNNGYSKHFRDMTSGTKLKKMIKEHG